MNLENELRRLLAAKADAFAPAPQPRTSVVREARIRVLRRTSTTILVIAVAVLAGTTLTSSITPDQRAFAALAIKTRSTTADERAKAGVRKDTPSHEHAKIGEPITLVMLKENVQCMRHHGFDLPDPVATGQGWQVIVEESSPLPSESPDQNLRKRWAQAVFVDCRLTNVTDELVLGGRTREQIDGLVKCARAHGFVLPTPVETRPGEFEFDLAAASPSWGSQAWYRTVFVTCGLWRQH